jgi:hypothetical protein
MPGFDSIDNFISEITAGKFWRQEFAKLYGGAAATIGNWYELIQGNGTPAQYLHGNLLSNADFVTSLYPWAIGSSNWAYDAANHRMTRTANADVSTLSQTLRLKAGAWYYVVFTTPTWTAGTVTVSLGGNNGTARSTASTFRELIQCGTSSKDVVFTPDASGAGTIDLVSVQQVLDFLPYTDLTEGALWHGGDVSPDTKHLVNMGAWVNAATGVPSVLMLVDVLGAYPVIANTSAALQLLDHAGQTVVGTVIDNCQDAWNEQVITNVTSTLVVKATEGVTGASANPSCCKFAITDVFATGKICDEVVASLDMRRAEFVYMWLRSSINLDAGDLSWCTDETAALASSQDTVINTALTADTWTRVKIDVSAITKTDQDAIISIGLKANNDKNQTYNLYVDDVMFVREDPCVYNGKFTGNANGWTVNGTWAYRSNDVERTAGADGLTLAQTLLPVVQKCPYLVTYTIANCSAGGVTVSLGGTAGTQRTADGTYSETIICGTTNWTLAFTPDATFNGRIDDVYCFPQVPRCDATGEGVRMYYTLDNAYANGTGAANVSINYVNQAGTVGRSLGATVVNTASTTVAHLMHSGVAAGKYGPFLPLQAGDHGVRSVNSFQFSGAQQYGACHLVLCKPIASIPITTTAVAAERNLMTQLPSLPRIRDGACLMFIVYVGAALAANVQFQGYIDTAWS